jgi:cytochrome bd-type quinol oxidase subunit 2
MSGTHDTNQTADDGGDLDPQQAATLLAQTKRQAQRQFELNPPLLTLIGVAVIPLGYGAVWLSVRGQHPYQGPNGAALAAIYTAVIVALVATAVVAHRATSGVSGRSRRQQRAAGVAFGTAWIAVSVFQGALYHDGASKAIVYGVYPAAAPLLVIGAALAAYAAAREDWRQLGVAIAVVVLAIASAFAGPTGVWGVIAVGGGVIGLGYAAVQRWLRRAPGR